MSIAKTCIIAEIGQNHCGDMFLAKTLIGLAKLNGGDLCKFQLYDHQILYGENGNIPNVELSFEQAKDLFQYGDRLGIEVFFSVFDLEKIKWCEEIGVKRYKIACSQRHNKPLVEAVRATRKPIMISTDKQDFYKSVYYDVLYCVPKYPASIEDIDWNLMQECNGFSDHTIGLEAAELAIDNGARIIEKHFAINHKTGVDAKWSMTPKELKELKRWAMAAQFTQ